MAGTTDHLSDKAMSVFAFAIYHQLESGARVRQVVKHDGAGHHADSEAISELQALGLVAMDGDRVSFTEEGEAMLDRIISAVRDAAATPSSTRG